MTLTFVIRNLKQTGLKSILKSKTIIVGCFYRHHHNTNIDEFISYFNKCRSNLNKENKEAYISGDFNIDLLKYESNPKYREFYNLVTANGFLIWRLKGKQKGTQIN